jgi:hypothetical protein
MVVGAGVSFSMVLGVRSIRAFENPESIGLFMLFGEWLVLGSNGPRVDIPSRLSYLVL